MLKTDYSGRPRHFLQAPSFHHELETAVINISIVSLFSVQARDPIPQFRKFALAEGLMSDADVKDIEKQIVAEVEEAVKFADESPKPVSTTPA